jgi:hypothetical protein
MARPSTVGGTVLERDRQQLRIQHIRIIGLDGAVAREIGEKNAQDLRHARLKADAEEADKA